MTERQRRFAEFYAANPNATEAARKAGYSERTAGSIGSENLKKPEILEYIRMMQDQTAELRIMTAKQIRAELSDIVRDQTARPSDRISASNVLLRSFGSFVHLKPNDDDPGGWIASKGIVDDVVVYLPELEAEPDDELQPLDL